MQNVLINAKINICQIVPREMPRVKKMLGNGFVGHCLKPKDIHVGDFFVRKFPNPENIIPPIPTRPSYIDPNPTTFQEVIGKKIQRLILANLEGKGSKYNKLEKLLLKEGESAGSIRNIISAVETFKTKINDPIIKAAIKREVEMDYGYYSYRFHVLEDLVSLVKVDSSLYCHPRPFNIDNYKKSPVYKVLTHLIDIGDPGKVVEEIRQTPINHLPKTSEARWLKNGIELEALKSYIKLGVFNEYNALPKYLYEQYYLSRLSPETRNICKKILQEFDTKVFLEDETDPIPARKIVDELTEWANAAKAKQKDFKSPLVIDINRWDPGYIENKDSGGYYCDSTKIVSIKNNLENAIRHEIVHSIDPYINSYSGSINGRNMDEIIVRGPVKPSGQIGDLIWSECKYKDEFFNAGISPSLIRYAYKDAREFKAVAAQGDYSKYSPEFKKLLVDIGLPEYVFDMKPESLSVNNAEFFAELRKHHPELNTIEKVRGFLIRNAKSEGEYSHYLDYFSAIV